MNALLQIYLFLLYLSMIGEHDEAGIGSILMFFLVNKLCVKTVKLILLSGIVGIFSKGIAVPNY